MIREAIIQFEYLEPSASLLENEEIQIFLNEI